MVLRILWADRINVTRICALLQANTQSRKVHMYSISRVQQCMFPRRILDLPTPLAEESVAQCAPSPPGNQRWGAHLPAGEGVGEPQFRRLQTKLSTLSLSTLCSV